MHRLAIMASTCNPLPRGPHPFTSGSYSRVYNLPFQKYTSVNVLSHKIGSLRVSTQVKKLMLSALKSMALHGIKWHFSALTFDVRQKSALKNNARQNLRNHFGISWRKPPFPLDFDVNFFTRAGTQISKNCEENENF